MFFSPAGHMFPPPAAIDKYSLFDVSINNITDPSVAQGYYILFCADARLQHLPYQGLTAALAFHISIFS